MNQGRATMGTLVISIDVAPETPQPQACVVSNQLLSLMGELSIPATWAFADPTADRLADRLLAAEPQQEVALLCQADWAADTAGRTKFAQQLKSRVGAASQRGFQISTLAMQSATLTSDLDLLVKRGISVIRDPLGHGRPTGKRVPVAARFGVWSAPVATVPAGRQWPWTRSQWLWKRSIRTTMQRYGYLQLGIDQATVKNNSLESFECLLHVAALLRESGFLEIRTLRQYAGQLTRKRTHPAARSVLAAA